MLTGGKEEFFSLIRSKKKNELNTKYSMVLDGKYVNKIDKMSSHQRSLDNIIY